MKTRNIFKASILSLLIFAVSYSTAQALELSYKLVTSDGQLIVGQFSQAGWDCANFIPSNNISGAACLNNQGANEKQSLSQSFSKGGSHVIETWGSVSFVYAILDGSRVYIGKYTGQSK